MVRVSDEVAIDELRQEVRALHRTVRTLALLMDAMREAWLLPPIAVLRDERRALRAARGATCPPQDRSARVQPPTAPEPARAVLARPAEPPPEALEERARARRAAPHNTGLARIREQGRAAAHRALTEADCPYKGAAGGYRKAWIEGFLSHAGKEATT